MSDELSDQWWISSEAFDRGGQRICGPFSSRTDAMVARAYIERIEGHSNYWIQREVRAPSDPQPER